MDSHIKDAVCNDWCDGLCEFTLQEVREGVRDVFRAVNGKAKSINEFQVIAAIRESHKRIVKALPSAPPAPERERVTVEAAAGIMAKAGFNPKEMRDANGKGN